MNRAGPTRARCVGSDRRPRRGDCRSASHAQTGSPASTPTFEPSSETPHPSGTSTGPAERSANDERTASERGQRLTITYADVVMTADRVDQAALADRRAVLALSILLLAGFDPADALDLVHFTIEDHTNDG